MADFNQINQFGSAKPSRSGEGMSCAECEAMLTDFIDGTLPPKDRIAFDLHMAACTECSQMLADAQRGAALLEMLKSPRPEPAASLIERIMAQTCGVPDGIAGPAAGGTASGVLGLSGVSNVDGAVAGVETIVLPSVDGIISLPAAATGTLLPFRARSASKFSVQTITRTMMQPRLAMTAAMAFFSIALTMNLTGVHLSELKASDLKPSSIRRTFYQADASLVRYYDNLRVVYELESRVSDLKQSSESDGASSDGKSVANGDPSSGSSKDKKGADGSQKHSQPKAGGGTSQRRSPLLEEFQTRRRARRSAHRLWCFGRCPGPRCSAG